MTELIIEGVRADVYESLEAKFTYQIDDIKSFGTRNTSFSKTIKIPATAKNKAIFGFVERTDIANNYNPAQANIGDNFNPAVAAKCLIINDYVQIFKGVIRILEVVTIQDFTEYECSVFGELGGFMSAIANKYLTDLDFSAYDTTWTHTNIANSWNTIAGSGVYFGMGDYGNVSTSVQNPSSPHKGVNWDFKAFRPALYLQEYLEKIAAASGYTVDISDLTSITQFSKIVIPHNEDFVYINTAMPLGVNRSTNQTVFEYFLGYITSPQFISFPNLWTLNSFTANGSNNEFTYTGSGSFTGNVTLNLVIKHDSTHGFSYGNSFNINLYKNGTFIGTAGNIPFENNSSYTGGLVLSKTFNGSFTINTTISSSDYISVKCEPVIITNDKFAAIVTNANMQVFTAAQSFKASYSDTLTINNCIPKNIKQTDFFTLILKMFNCYVIEDKTTEKKIKITPYPDFYYPLATAINWTDKVDLGSEVRLKPMSELNARFFNYLYDVDTDFINDLYKKKYGVGYGEYLLDTNYEFSKEKSECKVIFSGSPLFSVTGVDKQWSVFFKSSDNGVTEAEQTTKIRLLIAKKIACTSYNIINGVSNYSKSYYGYMGHLDNPTTPAFDLNWNNPKELYYALSNPYPTSNLFNNYWLQYMTEIIDKDSKLLTCNVWLTKEEVAAIDFSVPIYINGSLFKLNKILDFDMNNNETTKVELLKIV